ncbi:hypothetical protein CFP56_039226 [Quercus suber]|uniref:Uncharacterized protein n=1 Tax=Quercus suber TaxID=58331 RepID=A0AAW0IZZ8_QUESU
MSVSPGSSRLIWSFPRNYGSPDQPYYRFMGSAISKDNYSEYFTNPTCEFNILYDKAEIAHCNLPGCDM